MKCNKREYFQNPTIENDPIEETIEELQEDVAELQEDVAEINEKIDNLYQRHFLFFGDSYMEGWYPGVTTQYGFADRAMKRMGIDEDFYKVYAKGGAGFGRPNYDPLSFYAMAQTAISEISNKDEITDIVIMGGFNDNGNYRTSQNIDDGMSACLNLLKNNFRKAKISVGMIGALYRTTLSAPIYTARTANFRNVAVHYSFAGLYGTGYMNNSEFILHDSRFFATDNIHPNELGQDFLANYLVSFLQNKNIDVILPKLSGTGKWYNSDKSTQMGTFSYATTLHNNSIVVDIEAPTVDARLSTNGEYLFEFDVNNCIFLADYLTVNGNCVYFDANIGVLKYEQSPFRFFFDDNKMKLKIERLLDNGTGYKTAFFLTALTLNISVQLPSMTI